MKKILPLIIISSISLFVFFLSSCKKDPVTTTPVTPNNNNNTYYFRCKIDGVDWVATVPTGNDTTIFNDTAYVIFNNTSATTNQLMISLLPFDSITWVLESASYIDNTYNIYDANFTDVNLHLSVNNNLSTRIIDGTFSFKLYDSFNDDTLQFTNGEFKTVY